MAACPKTVQKKDVALRKLVLDALVKYSSLRFSDIVKILASQGVRITYNELVKIAESSAEAGDASSATDTAHCVAFYDDQQEAVASKPARNKPPLRKATSVWLKYVNVAPSQGRRLDIFQNHVEFNDRIPEAIVPQLSSVAETRTLVQDVHKAFIHQDLDQLIRKPHTGGNCPLPHHWCQTDQFLPVMEKALEKERLNVSRPVLVHELANYPLPYMTRFSAIRRLLLRRCVKTAGEKKVVDRILSEDVQLNRLRSQAPAPPEMFEPLIAFHGLLHFSYDVSTRLEQKLASIDAALTTITHASDQRLVASQFLETLPENVDTAKLSPTFPFRHMFGFRSAVPSGVSGSIRMGSSRPTLEKQLATLRYPTLQRVAHDLPVDPGYRESTVHAIRVLERNKAWPFHQKIQFVNALKEVQGNLAPSHHYANLLNAAFPKTRQKFMINSRRALRPRGIDGAWVFLSPLRTIAMRKKVKVKKR